jgi:hypothetical protein
MLISISPSPARRKRSSSITGNAAVPARGSTRKAVYDRVVAGVADIADKIKVGTPAP